MMWTLQNTGSLLFNSISFCPLFILSFRFFCGHLILRARENILCWCSNITLQLSSPYEASVSSLLVGPHHDRNNIYQGENLFKMRTSPQPKPIPIVVVLQQFCYVPYCSMKSPHLQVALWVIRRSGHVHCIHAYQAFSYTIYILRPVVSNQLHRGFILKKYLCQYQITH